MPIDEEGQKWSCIPCIHGHRTAQCNHYDRWMVKVRKPGRPARGCQHAERQRCECGRARWMMVEVRHDPNAASICRPIYSETDMAPDEQTHQQRDADVQREMARKQQEEDRQRARLPPTPPDSQASSAPGLQQHIFQYGRRETKKHYRQQHQQHHHQHHQQQLQQQQRLQLPHHPGPPPPPPPPPIQMLPQSPIHYPLGGHQQPLYFPPPTVMGMGQQQQLPNLMQPNTSIMSHIDPCIGQHEHFGEYGASLALMTEPSTHQTNCCSSSGSKDAGDAGDGVTTGSADSRSSSGSDGLLAPVKTESGGARCSCPSPEQCHCKNCDDHPFNPPNNRVLAYAFQHLHPDSQNGMLDTGLDALGGGSGGISPGFVHQHDFPSYIHPPQMTVDPTAVMPPPSHGITTRSFLLGFSESGETEYIEARDGLNLDPAWCWTEDLNTQ